MMESLRVIGLSVLLLGANVALYGQQIRGSIVGNVTDASGSAVPEAQITVKNEETGIEFKTRTDSSGTYTVPGTGLEIQQLGGGDFTVPHTAVRRAFISHLVHTADHFVEGNLIQIASFLGRVNANFRQRREEPSIVL